MREVTSEDGAEGTRTLPARALVAAPLIGIVTFAAMVIASLRLDLPIHDPDGAVLGSPLILIAVVMIVFIALDVIPRGAIRAGWPPRGMWSNAYGLLRDRWDRRRLLIVVGALLGFYLTYVGYRNLKSFLPFARDDNFDSALLDLDRDMAFGNDPAGLLHDLLGRGISAQILSFVYLAYLLLIPVSLGIAVVWQRRLHRGLWYVTAMNLSWVMGAISYYSLPALGPAFVAPERFEALTRTGVTDLQQSLAEHRTEVLASPETADGVQSIAAFASLHVAIVFVAALIAQLLGLRRWVRCVLWAYLGLTALATVYFGWHYLIDDVAGVVIGLVAVLLGAKATGHELRPARAPKPVVGSAQSSAEAT